MNLVDALVAWVNPAAGLRRAHARAALKSRHYEAATTGRRLSGRNTGAGDANTVMRGQMLQVAKVARDLVRNNAWAAKALSCIVGNVVGSGIASEPRMKMKGKARLLRDAWAKWAGSNNAHAAGQLDWYGLQALALRAVVESGSVFVVKHLRKDSEYPLSLKVLEREYLDTSKGIQGIEYDDKDGRATGYWLYTQHPGDSFDRISFESTRFSAKDVIHLYRIDRPGQRDGMSWFSPVVLEIHDLDGYEDATLLKQKVAACHVGFITRADNADPFATTDSPLLTDALQPGALEILPRGADVKFSSPPSATEYTPFVKQRLRRIAAGMGISYEAFTGDMSEVNYSSGRMGWAEFQRTIDATLWQMLIPMLIERVTAWFVQSAQLIGVDASGAEWSHNPPRRTVVDPAKEYPALIEAIRGGLMTLPEALRDLGKSFDVQMQEHADANAELDRLKLVVESDARKPMAGGAAPVAPAETTPQPAPEVPP